MPRRLLHFRDRCNSRFQERRIFSPKRDAKRSIGAVNVVAVTTADAFALASLSLVRLSVCGQALAFRRNSGARNNRNSFRVCGPWKHANKRSIPLAPFRRNDAFVYLAVACANAAYIASIIHVVTVQFRRYIRDWYYSPLVLTWDFRTSGSRLSPGIFSR